MYEFSPLVLLICFLRPHVFLWLAEGIHSQKLCKCEHAKKPDFRTILPMLKLSEEGL